VIVRFFDRLFESGDCRSLIIPADSEWLALFGGALTELEKPYNWEFSGGLTIDETIQKMREIINNWYTEPCAACTLPGGGRIIRIGAHGHIEELGDNGEWGDPTGDYVIPPPEPRTDGTPADQKCLAAKNAVNVLQQLYESLSESWASHLSEAEAGTEFIIAAVAIIGFEFAPITFGIVAFFEVVFAALYTALEYLGADLWDANFTDQLTCFMLECATDTDGVVTFDWDCLMARLNSLVDSFGLSELQIRLYLQVSYILYFIGGIDGLNLAGRTTSITDDDCGLCGLEWCVFWPWTEEADLNGFTAFRGTWVSGDGYDGVFVSSSAKSVVELDGDTLPSPAHFNHLEITYSAAIDVGSGGLAQIDGYLGGVRTLHHTQNTSGSHVVFSWDGDEDFDAIVFAINSGSDATTAKLERAEAHGTGTPPDIGTPCE